MGIREAAPRCWLKISPPGQGSKENQGKFPPVSLSTPVHPNGRIYKLLPTQTRFPFTKPHFTRPHCSHVAVAGRQTDTGHTYWGGPSPISLDCAAGDTALAMHLTFHVSHEAVEFQECICLIKELIDLISSIFMSARLCFIQGCIPEIESGKLLPGWCSSMFPKQISDVGPEPRASALEMQIPRPLQTAESEMPSEAQESEF